MIEPLPHIAEPEPLSPPPPVAGDARLALRQRLLAIAEILVCSSVPTQILIAGLLWTLGVAPLNASGGYSLVYVVSLALGDTVVLVALMVAITRAHGERPADLWLGRRPPAREILAGLALVPLIFLIVVLLLASLRVFAPWLHNVETNPLEQLASNGAVDAAVFTVVAILAGGVREELQRAFLMRRFERHLGGANVGIVVISVAFGAGHVVQGWDAMITTGVLGAVWAIVYVRRRSSIAPIVSHAGFNSLEILRLVVAGQ